MIAIIAIISVISVIFKDQKILSPAIRIVFTLNKKDYML